MIGRFLNPDSVYIPKLDERNRVIIPYEFYISNSMFENILNLYAFVMNSPLDINDPYGENIYGNFCGPEPSPEKREKMEEEDDADRCCKEHDVK